ncbi:ankyrin repeat domain-containing protein 39 isoform X1 [Calonectris borealis]|uniref:ankyrin repeat domain-containing protein 39 isoform X1 n=1 Tax=Calonectris borealis TaxID=1323832 RepID=UPI003F4C6E2C
MLWAGVGVQAGRGVLPCLTRPPRCPQGSGRRRGTGTSPGCCSCWSAGGSPASPTWRGTRRWYGRRGDGGTGRGHADPPAHTPACPVPSPQHYASRNGHLGVCRLLLQRGARCDARTPGGATPLHRASYCGHLAVARLLLAHGADPATADEDGRTSLHKAAEQGHRELCALLLRHSPALAGIRDAKGRRPRDVADPAVQDLLDT